MIAQMTYCRICDKETMHHSTKCTVCAERERRLERAKWLALTSEEKIDALLMRIEHLEQNPLRF